MTRKREKRGPGHPPFIPTPEQRLQVEALIGLKIHEDDVCRIIINKTTGKPLSPKTLRKYFAEEIRTGQVRVKAGVMQSLFQKAVNGDTTAAIFMAKNLMGWRSEPKDSDGAGEKKEITVVVKGGLPDDDD